MHNLLNLGHELWL